MTISDRDRKILWARAGNRCSVCRRELIPPISQVEPSHAVVGEECHIVSSRPRGPRARPDLDIAYLDSCDNLILLCPSDHTLVDQQVQEYPEQRLKDLKAAHEAWVASTLGRAAVRPKVRRGESPVLLEVTSGRELLAIMAAAHESSLDHEELETQEEADEVGGFLQNVFDWGEMWSDMEPSARVHAEFEVGQHLRALKGDGWRVFAARARGTLEGGDEAQPSRWDTAYVRVVRVDSPEIMRIGATAEPRT